ncbi:UDP-2,4-diacetamido-2,4,6-trideoxy-beta-L-altropyranose hydrolase [Oceanospirillum linum]|uniref:UDP-2,4-diacetamido-2,4, 6-trideoxy-beta-L-altropyranose hydrolase n=1 Tax=Oceanospirillum linum TaxID=966 RepID=A0A1T1HFG7_OCELI|nr:UDP-2,4-diacetamido-2,4,6-trideoxy-beta-L-altropyranose hydrolase [Oceanospirillum linum]OOV88583.1 UDP-2,4-diacetamido-2,4,6-trideoxy-beta-L-altropyranose hydrolase [Oceanospirillum linum]SEF61676.1 UDP-2,4-diacetamido-2,4,6-trideoxy-beta-L-altropyranose hydrolase [Oleiphilus messinensis]SMP07278.1 UDP-2,4-diacetamido-2,4,6-trideoxy-beta-L-altropyranose hydrolase [Oceanospirillum linum]
MKVAFRTDASIQIGTGHVMRCLTLATELQQRGHTCSFICRDHPGHLAELIASKGFAVERLPPAAPDTETSDLNWNAHASWLGASWQQDAEQTRSLLQDQPVDWLVVDHYALDARWEQALKLNYKKLMVIDDLGDREHLADLLLEQNYGSTAEKYQGLVPDNCKILAGTQYALLRPEFAQWREYSLKRRKNISEINSILITMGGVDPDNYTGKILEQLAKTELNPKNKITVVMGATAPHLATVKQQAAAMPVTTQVKANVSNMAELMSNADLAIGAAGATTWERCCLGLPTIQLVIAENQRQIANALAKENMIILLEKLEVLPSLVVEAKSRIDELSQLSASSCDGKGSLRIGRIILEGEK